MSKQFDIVDETIRLVVAAGLEAGYDVTIHNGVETVVLDARSHAEVEGKTRSTMRDMVMFCKHAKLIGWVMLDYKREPCEVLTDNTLNVTDILAPARRFAAEQWQTLNRGAA